MKPLPILWKHLVNDAPCPTSTILTAVIDGLKGIGEALEAVFPATTLQTCIVHLIRNSLNYASWKDRQLLAAALRPVYGAAQRRGRRRSPEHL